MQMQALGLVTVSSLKVQYGEEALTERQTLITTTISRFRAHEEGWKENKL